MKNCELRLGIICTECGECLKCDLNPNKLCDNCELCISDAEDFGILNIDEVCINN